MEVFFRGLSPHTSEKRLTDYLAERLQEFGVGKNEFLCEKKRGPYATLLLLDADIALRFITTYTMPTRKLYLDKPFHCGESRYKPTEFRLQSLEKTIHDRMKNGPKGPPKPPHVKVFEGSDLSCGVWDYPNGQLTYVPHYLSHRPIKLYFGKKQLVIMLDPSRERPLEPRIRIGIEYSIVRSIACCSFHDPVLTLTLESAPKFYEVPEGELLNGLARLSMRASPSQRKPKRIRLAATDDIHKKIVSIGLVYQIVVTSHMDLVKSLLRRKSFLPNLVHWPFKFDNPQLPLDLALKNLATTLQSRQLDLEFSIKFQLQRLAQNTFLHPHLVMQLIPTVSKIRKQLGLDRTVNALQQLSKETPFAGPDAGAEFFKFENLVHRLETHGEVGLPTEDLNSFGRVSRSEHLVLIHRARVTPTSIYLEGPYLESTNGVLGRYADRASTNFLRVSFEDENGGTVKWEPNAELKHIHEACFKRVLDTSIDIADQVFKFLGFSHSSLRDQSCWFLSPFVWDSELMFGEMLIARFGDFSQIRSPAKCAARIGQVFTDLNDNIPLPRSAIIRIPDIERNGRCFSDGCSTASPEVFRKVWKSSKRGRTKPTSVQMRYGGIKGMTTVDWNLKGEIIYVRPSQEKFPSNNEMLGICGAATRTLPLYLNRPMIKILEDLGVEKDIFVDFQTEAISRLRAMAESPINASNFLEVSGYGQVASIPWLIKELYYMGVPALEDHFLFSIVELILIMRLRDLKYKGRIPVEEGATLFGIMDETDTLEEGEVYCAVADGSIISGRVAITKSPCMHPGDIQMATAVDVPEGHALKGLHHCVVFSQRGPRDLPSKLGGGDLDGDLFNIIADPRLWPKNTVEAADYPRLPPIDIGRRVENSDISNFFLDFMSNDQLGRISNIHLQLADQKTRGTMDPECILLAGMHSTAVDFSKTGIPVDMDRLPKYPKEKPDFMASGPRVIMEAGVPHFEGVEDYGFYEDDEADVLAELDMEGSRTMFYPSRKALGHLYRQIDERQFLADLQTGKRTGSAKSQCALPAAWEYVQNKTQGILWDHLRDSALDIKEQYEIAISDMMLAHSLDPHKPLSELEVFLGVVLGKDGGLASKRAREAARTIKEQFDEIIQYTLERILRNEEQEATEEALEHSIACFAVALEDDSSEVMPRIGKLQSFKYFAASVCLRQVKRFAKDGF